MQRFVDNVLNSLPPIVRAVVDLLRERQVGFLAAGLAFYGALAVPRSQRLVAVFGLVADPGDAERLVADVLQAALDDVTTLVASSSAH